MMRFKNLALVLPIYLSAIIFLSNTDGKNKAISWEPTRKLAWTDFRDTIIKNSDRVALTSSGMRVNFAQTDEKTIQITAVSEMIPDKSWVDSTKKSDYMLSHEQYHFNITEYWCRKLKYDIATTRLTSKNFKEKLTEMQKANFVACKDMQDAYDKETNHSMVQPKQVLWQERIDDLLRGLDTYAKPDVKVTLK